ncbi:unnamed protein product [Rotaria sp. Silwood2]|nr:unnamed protein product [Rotaria sp. Silwood2]CAF2858517.1 unnamed protein product [Rotaria sp. Silwood2]CAF2957674.1 unnamed protein product [Rotaria sp. Silwood2]CAF3093373.1 unnamed protein product [Rotaria sp. Silwood2]CAF4120175.1 unnamed protein product [Rotaria sp. Silwood2]
MLRHDYNGEKTTAEEKSTKRHESQHGRLSRKSTSIIDHLKTKVKQKRLSKNDSFDLSNETLNLSITGNINTNNNNNNNKRSDQDHNESQHKRTSTATRSRSITPSVKNSKELLFNNNEIVHNDDNNVFIENNEQDAIVPNETHNDKDIEENIQRQRNSIKSNTNKKITRSQPKFIKSNSTFTEITNQSNAKKRRQMLRPTSFQIRDEDFHVIFSDLPSDEQLVIAYPCAWRKDVFMHGRIFLSTNYLLFYARFFKWEESLRIPYKDIISVTREKSAIVLPNAIKLRKKNEDEYLFASYIPREKIFIAIFRLWQNALLGQPLGYQQLRAFILADQYNHDDSGGDSEEYNALENNDEYTHKSVDFLQPSPVGSNSSTESLIRSIEAPTRPVESSRRTISFKLDDENVTHLRTCTCETHLGKTFADRLFSFNVDTLFELLFGDNSFTRAFHSAQKLADYTFGVWNLNTETGKRERQVSYKTISQSVLGTNTLFCREKQILEVEKPHFMYILNTEVYNEGMRYTDTFYVATRFCMVQYDADHSSLRVTAEIRYIKNVNGFIRTFIEKNVNSSIEGGINEQVRRLESHHVTDIDQKSNQKSMPLSGTRSKQSIDNNIPQKQSEENSSVNIMSLPRFKLPVTEKTIAGEGRLYDIGLLIGICFLLVHIYLWYKLNSIEQALLPPETICLNQCRQNCK